MYARCQHRHGVGIYGKSMNHTIQGIGKKSRFSNPLTKGTELFGIRQFTINYKIGRLQKGRLSRKLLDRIAAITEDAFFSVDKSHLAFTGTCISISVIKSYCSAFLAKSTDIDRLFSLRPSNQVNIVGIVFDADACVVFHDGK